MISTAVEGADEDMVRIATLLALCAGTMTVAVLGEVRAQASADQQAYRPNFGDLMTTAVQPRHIKLGLAGQERNWPYAAYALRELQGAFQRIAHAVPVYRSTDMAALSVRPRLPRWTTSRRRSRAAMRTSLPRPTRNSPRPAMPVIRARTTLRS